MPQRFFLFSLYNNVSQVLRVTGNYVKVVVNLLCVVHCHLCFAAVTLYWVKFFCGVQHWSPASPLLRLFCNWEFEPLVGGDSAVDDKHRPVLSFVDCMALTVQTQ